MISFTVKGDFKKTTNFLNFLKERKYYEILEKYAKEGVLVLRDATPVDTGLTADSWDYNINIGKGYYSIEWTNSNVNDGIPIAILIQYGHATKNGGYVEGNDFINPAMKPLFEEMSEKVWEEIKNA